MKHHKVFLVSLLILLAGCAAKNTPFTGKDANQYTQYQVSSDRARIYVVNGIMLPDPENKKYVNRGRPWIFLDGTNIGQIQGTDVMVFDVDPGTYAIEAVVSSTNARARQSVELKAGEYAMLRANYNEGWGGAGGAIFGIVGALIGSAAAPPSGELERVTEKIVLNPKDLVLPLQCPETKCKK